MPIADLLSAVEQLQLEELPQTLPDGRVLTWRIRLADPLDVLAHPELFEQISTLLVPRLRPGEPGYAAASAEVEPPAQAYRARVESLQALARRVVVAWRLDGDFEAIDLLAPDCPVPMAIFDITTLEKIEALSLIRRGGALGAAFRAGIVRQSGADAGSDGARLLDSSEPNLGDGG